MHPLFFYFSRSCIHRVSYIRFCKNDSRCYVTGCVPSVIDFYCFLIVWLSLLELIFNIRKLPHILETELITVLKTRKEEQYIFEERYYKQRLEWMLTNHPNLQKKKTRWFINVMIYFHFCHSTTQPEVLDKVSFASCNSGIIDGLKPRYYSRKNRIECVSNHTRCVM